MSGVVSQDVHVDFGAAMGAPHIDQWFGVWAMEERAFSSLLGLVQSTNIKLHLQEVERRSEEQAASGSSGNYWYRRDVSGVAVMSISGSLQKHRQSMSNATSTVLLRREIRSAAADPDIGAILLHIDSPGGTASGTQELADDIAAVEKPVLVHVDDLGASAAYWVASAGDSIAVNKMGMVGSIGTYAVVMDYSQRAAQEGIKVHVLRTGKYKGDTVPGMEISPDTLADIQSMVEARNEIFLSDVSRGRKISMDKLREIADGRVYLSNEAKRLGLVDKVQSFDDSFRDALEESSRFLARGSVKSKGTTRMSVATAKEIKAACPGCSSDFIVECQERERDAAACKDAWMQDLVLQLEAAHEQVQELDNRVKELTASNAELESQLSEAKAPKDAPKAGRGVEPLQDEGTESTASEGDDTYEGMVQKLQREKDMSRGEAKAYVNKHYPELRAAYVAAVNND